MTLGFCPSCGTQREKGALWCMECGYSFEANPNAPQRPRPQRASSDGGTRLGQSISQGFGFGCGCLLVGVAIIAIILVLGNLN